MDTFYRYEMEFKPEYIDFDFMDRIKTSSLFVYMQEVAGRHADLMGIGTHFLWPRHWGFIVTNNYLEILKPVGMNDFLRVKTWPLAPGKVTFERHYEFYNEKGVKVAIAASRWCLLDLNSKRMLPVSELKQMLPEKCDVRRATSENPKWKISSFEETGLEPVFGMKVYSSEYDHYMHVNNTRYVDFIMNCFTVKELSSMSLKSIQISYEMQCTEGEELSFYRKQTGEGEYVISGVKNGNVRFLRAKVIFESDSMKNI